MAYVIVPRKKLILDGTNFPGLWKFQYKRKKINLIKKETLQCQIRSAATPKLEARNAGLIIKQRFHRWANARIAASQNSYIEHVQIAATITAVRSSFQKKPSRFASSFERKRSSTTIPAIMLSEMY